MNKLIIIRGPSGAGKSTVAKALMARVTKHTALLARDQYMFMFNGGQDEAIDRELIEHDILFCLERGLDVIFEGNFKISTHKEMLERLFKIHPDSNYVFYLEASLAETLRRHDTRKEKIISKKEMEELYDYATPMNHQSESIIPEGSSLDETVNFIRKTAKI